MDNTKLFIILGNQLFNPNLYFKQINQYDFFFVLGLWLMQLCKASQVKITTCSFFYAFI